LPRWRPGGQNRVSVPGRAPESASI